MASRMETGLIKSRLGQSGFAAKLQVPGKVKARFERLIGAPPEKVWEAFTKPDMLAKWFAPQPFKIPVCRIDLKKGGELYLEMEGPDGNKSLMRAIYTTISKPSKLAYIASVTDDHEKVLFSMEQAITLMGEAGKTRLVWESNLIEAKPEAAPSLEGMEQGSNMSLDNLESLVGEREGE